MKALRDAGASLLFWMAALGGLAVARVPYLTSPLYILDNDEAVLGIMARRMARGDEMTLFFAGQNYGLAIFESLPAAAAFVLFGDSAAVLTATVLVLFLAAIVVYAGVFEDVCGRAWSRVLVVVLAMIPGWIVWSTKARGLYVSGFLLAGVILYLLREVSVRRVMAVGVLSGLLALVQPLWLVVVVPIGVHRAMTWVGEGWTEAPRGLWALAGSVAVAVWLVPTLWVAGRDAFWQPDRIGVQLTGLRALVPALGGAFAGQLPPHRATPVAGLVGWAGVVAHLAVMTALAAQAYGRRSREALVLAAAMLASVLHVVVLQVWVPRYFLPATVLTFLGAAHLLGSRGVRFGPMALTGSAAAVSALAAVSLTLGQPPPGSILASVPVRDDLAGLIRSLEEDGVEAVYAASSDIQWQLLFYGDGGVPVRGLSATDRYPELVEAVDAVREAGGRTTLVADVRRLRDQLPELAGFPGYRVGERYLRLDGPSDLVLSLLGFESSGAATANGGSRPGGTRDP